MKNFLLFAMQLLIFSLSLLYRVGGLNGLHKEPVPSYEVWWAQMDFLSFGCFATKWPCHFRLISFEIWWAQMDSDHRPHAYQACALTSWAMSPYGGGNRVRTDDPLLAGQVLYQLSYTPISSRSSQNKCPPCEREATLLKTNKKETIEFPID